MLLSNKRQRWRIPPEWKDLPSELLKDVAQRLTSIADYISFRGVCTNWRFAATFDNFDTQIPRVPRLMYFVEEEPRLTNLLDLVSNTCKTPNFPPATDYPYLSSSGWILRLWKDSANVDLVHYLRRVNIDLPSLDSFPEYQQNSDLPVIRKMVLSTTPEIVIMVIWGNGNQLGFCRPGDKSWTIMDKWDDCFSDIIYEDRKLYAVDSRLRIVESDIHGSKPTKIVQVFDFGAALFLDEIRRMRSADCGWVVHNYLVKSSGKFLIVCRCILLDETETFRIFEIELKDGSCVEIHNLRGRCLFLGLNSSICAEFPVSESRSESSSTKLNGDCIYYTNTIEQCRSQDTGVYRFSDDEDCKGFFLCLDFCFPQPTMVVSTL